MTLETQSSFSAFSRYAQRVRRRYSDDRHLLPVGLPVKASLQACYAALARQYELAGALRITRALAIERLITLDCDGKADLFQIMASMTDLAEWALNLVLHHVYTELVTQHGLPQDNCSLWAIGMGKLGAAELNVSSDIDLIFVYAHEGQTVGTDDVNRGSVGHQEFFQKLVRAVCQLLSDVSEHGFVFRVDLALRPHGNSGPSAVSLAALEDYLLVSGREWERFAWLKSRVVACTGGQFAWQQASALREVVRPFVYRRYLDYGIFEALRQLHHQIRDHAIRRATGRPERANDVKLSRGGIREVEFIVQLLQVVRGGQFPELCTRSTLKALRRLSLAGLMPQTVALALSEAYIFLRRTEHRIQYLDDLQTHILPSQDEDCAWLAQSMGYVDCGSFLAALDIHRELVASEFDQLLGQDKSCSSCGSVTIAVQSLTEEWMDLSPPLFRRLESWQEDSRIQALREDSRHRLMRLLRRTLQWLRDEHVTETAVSRFIDWLEPLLRREAYLALLLERPSVHERLLRVLAAARWSQRYLMMHPGVIDELASESILTERFDAQQFESEVLLRHQALELSGQCDEENLMALLRRAQQAEVFRILVRDLEGRITVEQVADDLSILADTILRVSLQWAWEQVKERHMEQPQVALIAYGKLGGKELGYGSDLDLVCVYEDAYENASSLYAKLMRKLISWLSTKTAQGDLYDIDTALRPNGNAGLLVTSFDAFEDYQTRRGSNTAWTWEHQAMTRARCIATSVNMLGRFNRIRERVLTSHRNLSELKREITAMRQRVAAAHKVPKDRFDVKHSPGGMVDIEFAVQFLVLAYSHAYPALCLNSGNIALLQVAEQAKLLSPGIGKAAADAYREFRRAQHFARLEEQLTQLEKDDLGTEQKVVGLLWNEVFFSTRNASTEF
jgi:[glutamine synthetase] adenylyltransferase / [glutamine synthetase]-adenylyl-L-tyrosine phosphorylase